MAEASEKDALLSEKSTSVKSPDSSSLPKVDASFRLCYVLNDDEEPRDANLLVISNEEFTPPLDMNKTAVKHIHSDEMENIDTEKLKVLTSKGIEEHEIKMIDIVNELVALTTTDPLQMALQQEAFDISSKLPDAKENTILHCAASNGTIECLRFLLFQSCTTFPYAITNNKDYTIVHSALLKSTIDNLELILDMLEKSEDNSSDEGKEKIQDFLNAKTNQGHTALHFCVKYKKSGAIRPLLRAGVKLNICDNDGNTMIHLAAEYNDPEYIKRIANYHITDRSDTKVALDELAKCFSIKNADKKIPVLISNETQMIEIILKYSALHEVVDKEVGTLIHIAATENDVLLAQALVDKHVEMDIVNSKGFSPLKIASKRGHEGVVRILLEGGANPNFIGKRVPGFSPLNNAAQFGNLGCVKLLIFHGANLVHKDMTNTALHSASYGGHPDVVEYLIKEAGMYVNQKNNAGKTPLFQSITQNHSTVAKVLLDLGGDPNIILNNANETLMHIAVGEGRKEIMTMLLEAKASPDVSLTNGITPMMLAVEADHDDYIPLIMAHGITLAKKDEEGNTILHHMAKHNSCASARYILRRIGVMKGISQEFQLYKNKNNEDKCAYDVAVECGNEEILKIFVKYAPKGFFDDSKELHRFCDEELYGTLKETFSRFVTIKEGEGEVSSELNIFELNKNGLYPHDPEVKIFNVPLLHKLESCPDPELKYHPLVNFVVGQKLKLYNWFFIPSFLIHLIFLIFLGYALIQASTVSDSKLWVYDSAQNYFRAFCEIFCLLYFIGFKIAKKIEFCFKWKYTYVQKKKSQNIIDVRYFVERGLIAKLHVCRWLNSLDKKAIYFFSTFFLYLKNPFNFIDTLGSYAFFLLFILRIAGSYVQWTFAGLAFIFFTLTLLRHTRILPCIGSYVNTILGILSKEIPAFLAIIIIVTIAYFGGIHLAARQQQLSTNQTTTNNSFEEEDSQSTYFWFTPALTTAYDLRRPLLSGISFLLDGGLTNQVDNLLQANFFFTIVYLTFAFIIIVLMLNILTAQLVNAYSKVSKDRLKDYKMKLVVDLEKSFIVWFLGKHLRKFFIIKSSTVSLNYWKQLNEDYKNKKEDQLIADVNTELSARGKMIEKEFNKSSTSQEDLRNKVNELSREVTMKLGELSDLKKDIMEIKGDVSEISELKSLINEMKQMLQSKP